MVGSLEPEAAAIEEVQWCKGAGAAAAAFRLGDWRIRAWELGNWG